MRADNCPASAAGVALCMRLTAQNSCLRLAAAGCWPGPGQHLPGAPGAPAERPCTAPPPPPPVTSIVNASLRSLLSAVRAPFLGCFREQKMQGEQERQRQRYGGARRQRRMAARGYTPPPPPPSMGGLLGCGSGGPQIVMGPGVLGAAALAQVAAWSGAAARCWKRGCAHAAAPPPF